MTTFADSSPFPRETEGPATPLKPMRVGVVGLGRAGVIHAAVVSGTPNVELVGLADRHTVTRQEARGIGFTAPIFDRLGPLLDRARPEAVIVAAPLDERPGLVREALEAGVAVLAERPLAAALPESEALAVLAHEKGVPLACAHALPFHPVFAEVRAILAAAPLGAPKRVRASSYRSRVFDSGRQKAVAAAAAGGVLAHEAMDALFFLVDAFGAPREVRAKTLRLFGPFEDEAHVMMTLASGIELGLDASWSIPGYPAPATVIELEGENGKLLASDDAVELDVVEERSGFRAGHTRLGLADLPQGARFDMDGEAVYLMDAAFLAWVAGGTPPLHRADRAMLAHRVLEAIYTSAHDNGASVPLAPS